MFRARERAVDFVVIKSDFSENMQSHRVNVSLVFRVETFLCSEYAYDESVRGLQVVVCRAKGVHLRL